MTSFDKPRHIQCDIGCKNLYTCIFTCHNCRYRIINNNRCEDHRFNHDDTRTLMCVKCLIARNNNIKCQQHQLKLGEVDTTEDCNECKKKHEAYCDSDKFQIYEDDAGLSFCERCA